MVLQKAVQWSVGYRQLLWNEQQEIFIIDLFL